jgi:glycosyltransferase involved in cell wall biosynthesis
LPELIEAKVSVIIPIYNGAKHIEACLHSVLQQEFQNFEVLIINDGSTDATNSVCQEFIQSNSLESKYRVISVPNSGVSSARNIGLSQASGEYVAFLDSDDIWSPHKLGAQVSFLESNSDYIGCITSFYLFTDVDGHNPKAGRLISHKDLNSLKNGWLSLEGNGGLISSTLLYKRKNEIRFDLKLSTAADLDFFFQLCEKGQVAILDNPLVKYRVHDNQMHRNSSQFLHDYFLLMSKIQDPFLAKKKKGYVGNAYAMAALLELSAGNLQKSRRMLIKSILNRPSSFVRIIFFVTKKRFLRYLLARRALLTHFHKREGSWFES